MWNVKCFFLFYQKVKYFFFQAAAVRRWSADWVWAAWATSSLRTYSINLWRSVTIIDCLLIDWLRLVWIDTDQLESSGSDYYAPSVLLADSSCLPFSWLWILKLVSSDSDNESNFDFSHFLAARGSWTSSDSWRRPTRTPGCGREKYQIEKVRIRHQLFI